MYNETDGPVFIPLYKGHLSIMATLHVPLSGIYRQVLLYLYITFFKLHLILNTANMGLSL